MQLRGRALGAGVPGRLRAAGKHRADVTTHLVRSLSARSAWTCSLQGAAMPAARCGRGARRGGAAAAAVAAAIEALLRELQRGVLRERGLQGGRSL